MKLSPINFEFMSTKPAALGYEPRFRYRAGEVYKRRPRWWERLFLRSVAANRKAP